MPSATGRDARACTRLLPLWRAEGSVWADGRVRGRARVAARPTRVVRLVPGGGGGTATAAGEECVTAAFAAAAPRCGVLESVRPSLLGVGASAWGCGVAVFCFARLFLLRVALGREFRLSASRCRRAWPPFAVAPTFRLLPCVLARLPLRSLWGVGLAASALARDASAVNARRERRGVWAAASSLGGSARTLSNRLGREWRLAVVSPCRACEPPGQPT